MIEEKQKVFAEYMKEFVKLNIEQKNNENTSSHYLLKESHMVQVILRNS